MDQNKKKWVEVLLRNPLEKNQLFPYTIDCFDIPIVDRWLHELKKNLNQKLPLEKNFCFLGWPKGPRQLSYLLKELQFHVDRINHFAKGPAWGALGVARYAIREKFVEEQVVDQNGHLHHDIMNRLHRHFEVLQGQVDRLSLYYMTADDPTKYSIRQLNNLCHEIESWVNARLVSRSSPSFLSCAQITTFLNGPRFPLEKADYEYFTLDRGFGQVYMHWCQIGKTHLEVFCDEDKHVGSAGMGGLKYYSGEFDIEWGPDQKDWPHWLEKKRKFRSWLIEREIDPDDKTLGLGYLYLAQVDRKKHFGDQTVEEIQDLLSRYLDIYRITVYDGHSKTEGEFDYSWTDSHYQDLQLQFLKTGYHYQSQQSQQSQQFSMPLDT